MLSEIFLNFYVYIFCEGCDLITKLGIVTLQIVPQFVRFNGLLWLPDDGDRLPKQVDVDLYHVQLACFTKLILKHKFTLL
jgi:hypothetical protein